MILLQTAPSYVISVEEILWGGVLIAITMMMHGFGALAILRIHYSTKHVTRKRKTILSSILPISAASCAIILVHLCEVVIWAAFFLWKGCFPDRNISFYFALNEYTTLGSKYTLPLQWRLLEGMIATAGLLAFAWSTGILFTLAKEFQDSWMKVIRYQHRKAESE